MRTQTQEYLQKFLEKHPEVKKCLDVGSMEDGGGRIKPYFEGRDYTGLDMRKGENVDIVLNGHELTSKFKEESFDLVTCFDTFEHDDAFWITLEEMKKVVKKGGWLFLGFPSRYCPEHNHPNDYWRFMPQSMELMFKDFINFEMIVDKGSNSDMEDEIYGWGQKA